MNLVSMLSRHAERNPDGVALIDCVRGKAKPITFAAFEAAASHAAGLLVESGLQPGDVVLVFHPMATDLYIALSAILRVGAVAMFIDPSMGKMHIERCCALLTPRALLASPKAHLLRLISPALRRIPLQFATGFGALGAIRWQRWTQSRPHEQIVDCAPETPALITFTSGSTGMPKAAVRTHDFLRQQHNVLEKTLTLNPADIVLTTLPIFVLSHLAAGICTLMPAVDLRHPGRVKPAPILAAIQEHHVTCIEASPAFLDRVARYAQEKPNALPTLTQIFTGGAPVFPDLLERAQRCAPNARVHAVYGSTEAEPIAHVAYDEMSDADKTSMVHGGGLLAGKPVAAIQVRILPDRWGTLLGPFDAPTFQQQTLPAGTVGEIVVSGPHVLTGYLHGQGNLETKFQVDELTWHRTGDAGYFDEQARLWLLGRCVARIEDEHGILYPFAVEVAVHQHPNVKQAALIAHQGQRVLALECYQAPSPVELDTLQAQCAWAHIARIRVLPRLPVDKRHNAKVDYTTLHKLLTHVTQACWPG